jgi:microcin C transport system permease protein
MYMVIFDKEDIRFPYRPVKGHIMGIDGAGRDVFSRILYGLRTSLIFGLLLVFASMNVGIITGALQGYYGGAVDITGQRLIEVWSALPFLYIMILMGSVYGRSFRFCLSVMACLTGSAFPTTCELNF